MEFKDLLKEIADLIHNDILELNFDFRREEILMFITESEIPILIHKVRTFTDGVETETAIATELYTELVKDNLTSYDIYVLDAVVGKIESYQEVLLDLLS